MYFWLCGRLFLSTLSLRRATNDAINGCNPDFISIHALLAESDQSARRGLAPDGNFYPRSPCGERRFVSERSAEAASNFYPRSPCGERPLEAALYAVAYISIHALLAESDLPVFSWRCPLTYFYPRSPCGERLMLFTSFLSLWEFLSTLSLRRATMYALKLANAMLFLSTLSLRRATLILIIRQHSKPFLSTLSLRRATA